MRIIADLHLHSKYSRACSKNLVLPNIEKWARIKGVNLAGTGDFTHPKWIEHLKENLEDKNNEGVFYTKTGFPFILQTEVSLVYSQRGKGRRVHMILFAPSFEIVDQITEYFLSKGRIDYDGRPIFKIPAEQLVADMKNISDDIELIPAHIWTPWFSLFGSMSGFDDIEDCFGKETKHINALETGLSSDPPMNWRLSQLDKFNLVSFSDSNSFHPWIFGREATIFEIKDLTYDKLIKPIRTGRGLTGTIEVDPNYGKYHYDGHRDCGVRFSPKESIKHNNICPVCKKPLTIGVQHRIEQLADRHEGYKPKNPKLFKKLIPLSEAISNAKCVSVSSKAVTADYNKLLEAFGNEYEILLNPDMNKIKNLVGEKVAEYIERNLKEDLEVIPGFDGEYGIPIFDEKDKAKGILVQKFKASKGQKGIDDFMK